MGCHHQENHVVNDFLIIEFLALVAFCMTKLAEEIRRVCRSLFGKDFLKSIHQKCASFNSPPHLKRRYWVANRRHGCFHRINESLVHFVGGIVRFNAHEHTGSKFERERFDRLEHQERRGLFSTFSEPPPQALVHHWVHGLKVRDQFRLLKCLRHDPALVEMIRSVHCHYGPWENTLEYEFPAFLT